MECKYSEVDKVDELRMASDNVIPSHAAVNEVCVLHSLVITINSVSDKIYSLSRSDTHSFLGLLLTIRTTLNRNLGMCFETFDDMLLTIHVYLLPKVKIFQRLNFQVPNHIFCSPGPNFKSFLQSCKSYVGKVTAVAYLSVKRSLLVQ